MQRTILAFPLSTLPTCPSNFSDHHSYDRYFLSLIHSFLPSFLHPFSQSIFFSIHPFILLLLVLLLLFRLLYFACFFFTPFFFSFLTTFLFYFSLPKCKTFPLFLTILTLLNFFSFFLPFLSSFLPSFCYLLPSFLSFSFCLTSLHPRIVYSPFSVLFISLLYITLLCSSLLFSLNLIFTPIICCLSVSDGALRHGRPL